VSVRQPQPTTQPKPKKKAVQVRECVVCTERKRLDSFPQSSITKQCKHTAKTCRDCIATSIRTDLDVKQWNAIHCTECPQLLSYDDVQRLTDKDTFEKYQQISLRATLAASPNFIWCTFNCGHGQVHEGGSDQPIITCTQCKRRSCFQHREEWHESMSCEEYDAFRKDPMNFRSQFDLDNERVEVEAEAWWKQEEAAREYQRQKLEQLEQQERAATERKRIEEAAAAARRKQEVADRENAQRQLEQEARAAAERERVEEEARRRRERQIKEKAERRERERREREKREILARRLAEDKQSEKTVRKTTKRCPSCQVHIEKNQGW
jgi:hypothetical protein